MTTPSTTPKAPGLALGKSGARLWSEVAADFDLDPLEAANLAAACRQLDAVTALEAIAKAEGMTLVGPSGARLHPAVSEARQARVVLSKLLGAIRLPLADGKNLTARGERAQRAARARWGTEPRELDRHGRSTSGGT